MTRGRMTLRAGTPHLQSYLVLDGARAPTSLRPLWNNPLPEGGGKTLTNLKRPFSQPLRSRLSAQFREERELPPPATSASG